MAFKLFRAVPALALASAAFLVPAQAQKPSPRIAVTELAYQEQVREYFEAGTLNYKSSEQATHSESLLRSRSTYSGRENLDIKTMAGTYTQINQTELLHFTSDLKGLIIKGGGARLVQGKNFDAGDPQPTAAERAAEQLRTGKIQKIKKQPDVNDIVRRIRKGEFPGADYVLFGSVSSVNFKRDMYPMQGGASSHVYGLDIGADFNLINTKTLEIRAAFQATGSGSQTLMGTGTGGVYNFNKAKVMKEASQTLAEGAYGELLEQLQLSDPNFGRRGQQGGRSGGSDRDPAPPAELPAGPVTVEKYGS